MRSRTGILSVVASIALLGSVVPALAAPSPRATLAGSVPPWAKSANFKAAASPSDYVGFRVPDEFVVGYGLDYAERYRNLPDICILA